MFELGQDQENYGQVIHMESLLQLGCVRSHSCNGEATHALIPCEKYPNAICQFYLNQTFQKSGQKIRGQC